MRDLNQQFDQPINDLCLARAAPESKQGQTDSVRMAANFPGGLNRDAPAKPLNLFSMHTVQQIWWEGETAQQFKFVDLEQ